MATNIKSVSGYKIWHVALMAGPAVPLGQFRDDVDLTAQ